MNAGPARPTARKQGSSNKTTPTTSGDQREETALMETEPMIRFFWFVVRVFLYLQKNGDGITTQEILQEAGKTKFRTILLTVLLPSPRFISVVSSFPPPVGSESDLQVDLTVVDARIIEDQGANPFKKRFLQPVVRHGALERHVPAP